LVFQVTFARDRVPKWWGCSGLHFESPSSPHALMIGPVRKRACVEELPFAFLLSMHLHFAVGDGLAVVYELFPISAPHIHSHGFTTATGEH
jgi:hypothetical protein